MRIIRNQDECDECEKSIRKGVEISSRLRSVEGPCHLAYVCKNCLTKALKLLTKETKK